ncbi:MAG TPA: TIR domain-containing protein, partial [Pyrinomonadaceae bacterium]|nr:TIR domain-containing protein [Pyrinomonadaceae bacterium]
MRLFISYHSRDKVLANKLVETLRNQLGPNDEIFYDAQSLRGGSCWPGILANKIMEADAFVLLIADNGVGSWQILEYYEAFDQWVKTRKPLLVPVLKEGQSAPGLPFLKHLHWIIEPDTASERCAGRILNAVHSPTDGALTNPWRYTRPYRGLLAMDEADSDFFFGRASETEQVLQVLQSPAGRLPILVGNSGVGKTSIAQAGVLAAMKRQAWPKGSSDTAWPSVFQDSRRWAVLTIRPGTFPLQSLVEAFWSLWRFSEVDPDREALQAKWVQRLHEGTASMKGLLDATQERLTNYGEDAPPAFLLYLDQGEEVYTRADQEQARRFSSILADGVADPRLRAFASIRSDFYGQLQADQALCSVWERVDVHPLDREAIMEVITMPSQNLGASFLEHSLPGELARQTVQHTGYLPLLSYLLDDLWDAMQKRGDGLLLASVGTVNVGGVLAAAGDNFIHAHPDEVPVLKRIFTLKLIHMEEHGDPMRRRAFRSEFTNE